MGLHFTLKLHVATQPGFGSASSLGHVTCLLNLCAWSLCASLALISLETIRTYLASPASSCGLSPSISDVHTTSRPSHTQRPYTNYKYRWSHTDSLHSQRPPLPSTPTYEKVASWFPPYLVTPRLCASTSLRRFLTVYRPA